MAMRISIIGLDECSGHALMGSIDTFKTANVLWKLLSESKDDLFSVQIVSLSGQAITCSNKYTVSVDGNLDLVKPGDGIICIPFAASSSTKFLSALSKQQQLINWLRSRGNEFEFLGAVSVGVFLLADAGLMENKSVSVAWWFKTTFTDRYPAINVNTQLLCVKDGNILSSGPVKGYQDLCTELVERYAGKSFTKAMSRYMMDDYEQRSAAPQLFASQIKTNNPVVDQADAWIQRNLENEIRVGDIAEHVSVSTRTLTRYFQTAFGESPNQYLQKARIEKCKLLLDITELDFTQISYRCGYNDPGTLRRLFKKHCSQSPIEYRNTCRKNRLSND